MTGRRARRGPRSEALRRPGPTGRVVRPYGDDTDDGKVQVSFSLPVAADERGGAAAQELGRRMGLHRPMVVHAKPMGADFTFFIVYGAVDHADVDRRVTRALRRRAVVVGASLGTDAHTVGLDAILSLKGWAGEKGLESYRGFRVVNLRSQVDPRLLAERAVAEEADAVLVSQVVTQRDAHLHHLREFAETVDAEGLRGRFLMIAGGPGLDPSAAGDLRYDRVFGKGATPREVASYLAWALGERASGR